jgi:hypothetical protein
MANRFGEPSGANVCFASLRRGRVGAIPPEAGVKLVVQPPSSSGPGRRPFKAVARVRIPLGARPGNTGSGPVEQLECSPPCQGGGRGFKSRQDRNARPGPGSSVGTSVRLKSGRSAVRPRPWPHSLSPGYTAVISGNAGHRFTYVRPPRISPSAWSRFWSHFPQAGIRSLPPRRLRRVAEVATALGTTEEANGTIVLVPAVVMPESEARLLANHELVDQIEHTLDAPSNRVRRGHPTRQG